MKQLSKRLVYSSTGLLVALFASVSMPVFARDGLDNSGSSSSNTTMHKDATGNAAEVEHAAKTSEMAAELKQKAHDQLQAKRQEVKDRSQETREKVCKARKNGVENRLNNFAAQAQRHKDKFDSIYVKAKNFHDTKNLNVANYTELTAKVDTAQADAAVKIATLKSLDATIDCTQPNVADNVSAFRQALKNAKESLKTYRSALKDLLTALHDANKSTQSTTQNN